MLEISFAVVGTMFKRGSCSINLFIYLFLCIAKNYYFQQRKYILLAV